MPDPRPAITPETKVGDLLAAYPALEDVLVSLAPAFAKLRNPILRRTVARVATLEQAARVGGLEPRDLVLRLRRAAGVDDVSSPERAAAGVARPDVTGVETGHPGPGRARGPGDVQAGGSAATPAPPAWVSASPVAAVLDADALLDRGDHPLGAVRRLLATLEGHAVICVESSFVPAPLIDALRQQRCEVVSVAHADRHRTYIRKV